MPILADVPTSPEAQAVCDVFMRPYQEHMAALEGLKERDDVLKALRPDAAMDRYNEGAQNVRARFATTLSPATADQIARWLATHDALAQPLKEQWLLLSGNAAANFLRGATIGMKSQEAAIGRSIGGFFGPWGVVVGGALGAFAAVSQDSEQQQTAYWTAYTHWIAAAAGDFDLRVLPCIERDLHPWRGRLRSLAWWVVFIMFAVTVTWFFRH